MKASASADTNVQVKTLALGLGGVGLEQMKLLIEKKCDVFITGEVGEVCTLEYVREPATLGKRKRLSYLDILAPNTRECGFSHNA